MTAGSSGPAGAVFPLVGLSMLLLAAAELAICPPAGARPDPSGARSCRAPYPASCAACGSSQIPPGGAVFTQSWQR